MSLQKKFDIAKRVRLDLGDGTVFEGDAMVRLGEILNRMEEPLLTLERRSINLRGHIQRIDPRTGLLPTLHVVIGRREHWFHSRDALSAFLKEEEQRLGHELDVESGKDAAPKNGVERNGDATEPAKLQVHEFHEMKAINAGLTELAALGLDVQALVPQDRTGSEDPRYVVKKDEHEVPLEDLRGLLAALRAMGQKGMQVTRFKGLGEMDAEELRDTTLDPNNRLLLKVTMDDAGAADEMFRLLMGDKVEPRREFIEKHALEVKNLDV